VAEKRFMIFDDNGKPKRGNTNEEAIQAQLDALASGVAEEVVFSVSGDSTTDFSSAGVFTFDPSATDDITVHRNVSRQYLSKTGNLVDGAYIKLNSTTIRFLYFPKDGDKVSIRKEGNVGGLDLENISVNPKPAIDGAQSLGESSKTWSSIFVKDQDTGFPIEIGVSAGVLVLS